MLRPLQTGYVVRVPDLPAIADKTLTLTAPIAVTQLVRRATIGVPLRISRDGMLVGEHITASGDKNAEFAQNCVSEHVIEHGAGQYIIELDGGNGVVWDVGSFLPTGERRPLTVDDLLHHWQSEAVTMRAFAMQALGVAIDGPKKTAEAVGHLTDALTNLAEKIGEARNPTPDPSVAIAQIEADKEERKLKLLRGMGMAFKVDNDKAVVHEKKRTEDAAEGAADDESADVTATIAEFMELLQDKERHAMGETDAGKRLAAAKTKDDASTAARELHRLLTSGKLEWSDDTLSLVGPFLKAFL